VKGGLWFVRDLAEGRGNHLLEGFWHFAPELSVKEESGVIFALPPASEKSLRRSGLAMLSDRNSAWTSEITEGFVSAAYGSRQLAPVVRFSANVRLPEDCAVLLLPMTEMSDIGSFTTIGESSIQGARGYRYQTVRSTEFLFFAPGNGRWECGPWISDAALLYVQLDGRRLAHVIMVSGSFAEWRGKRFVLRSAPVAAFEWLNPPAKVSPDGDQAERGVVSEFEFVDSVL
jgi:hypothetical protein